MLTLKIIAAIYLIIGLVLSILGLGFMAQFTFGKKLAGMVMWIVLWFPILISFFARKK